MKHLKKEVVSACLDNSIRVSSELCSHQCKVGKSKNKTTLIQQVVKRTSDILLQVLYNGNGLL